MIDEGFTFEKFMLTWCYMRGIPTPVRVRLQNKTVKVKIKKFNNLSCWVELPDKNIIKRNIKKHIVMEKLESEK